MNKFGNYILFVSIWSICIQCSNQGNSNEYNINRIQPYHDNPSYWQYKGKPVLLIGGSKNDNLFQNIDVNDHLDSLTSIGGNYLRCTMSSRDSGDVYPYSQDTESGKYDLNRWNEEYWQRLTTFLNATKERDIIVQLEIWATYDFYTRSDKPWYRNPFHPDNNINYDQDESGLPSVFESRGGTLINSFFESVPSIKDLPLVLQHQKNFVDKLLSVTFNFNHILYCIDNETNAHPDWGLFWAKYIRNRAMEREVQIEVTEMWDTFDPTNGAIPGAKIQDPEIHFFTQRSNVASTLNHPEHYSFIDISNNSVQTGKVHFETGHWVWDQVQRSGIIRPVNTVKIYGSDNTSWAGAGNSHDAGERFWRNIFAGAATSRFHRPNAGLGLSKISMTHIKSMRMITDEFDIFTCKPYNNHLKKEGVEKEVYCLAGEDGNYAVVFFDSTDYNIDISLATKEIQVKWLDILSNKWSKQEDYGCVDSVWLTPPGNGFWAAVIKPK